MSWWWRCRYTVGHEVDAVDLSSHVGIDWSTVGKIRLGSATLGYSLFADEDENAAHCAAVNTGG